MRNIKDFAYNKLCINSQDTFNILAFRLELQKNCLKNQAILRGIFFSDWSTHAQYYRDFTRLPRKIDSFGVSKNQKKNRKKDKNSAVSRYACVAD